MSAGTSGHFRRRRSPSGAAGLIFLGAIVAAWAGQTAAAAEPSGKPLLVLDPGGHTAIVSQVCFTPDGRSLVSVSHDKTIRVWDVATGEPLRVLRPPIGPGGQGMLYAAAVSPDGRLLAAAGLVVSSRTQSSIYLISLDAGRIERVLTGHTHAIFALEFSRDGRLLASGGADKTARVWDVHSGACQHVLPGHGDAVTDVAFSPDGGSLATASHDGTARIWSLATAQTTGVLAGHRDDVGAVDWSPDGRTLATGSDDGSIRLWTPDGRLEKSFSDRGGAVESVAFAPDGRRLLYTVASDVERTGGYVVDLETGRLRSKYTGYDTSVYDGALSPDGVLAATTGGSLNEITLWATAGGALVGRLAGGGRTVVSCGWGRDGKTIVWGNTLGTKSFNDYGPLERAFHFDSLQPIPLPGGPFYRARSAGDGISLEKADEHTILARQQGQATTRLELDQRDRVLCGTLLPGRRAAVGSSHGLFLFDVRSGKALGEFRGHAGQVLAVALSPNEKYLLSASTDQTLRIWDPRYSAPLLSIFFVRSEWVAWTQQGYYAASPGGERLMGWQINHGWDQMASFHPAVQFRKTLYRPDMIRQLLEKGSAEQALLAAGRESGRTGEPTSVSEVLPPNVQLTAPQGPKIEVSQPSVEIRAVATPQGKEPILAMRLLLDGRPYQGRLGQRAIVRERARADAVEQTWTLELTPGVHQVAVKAETAASYAVSAPLEITFASDQVEMPALYVLAVGLSEHQDPRQRLDFGAKDARALASVL
ncbi:MAG: WD40 repeat domain-containing protein, partial [Planctomycetes bacterium]|nr:WD40 repeat domain-containing protein [Planctomycetota bacterium]